MSRRRRAPKPYAFHARKARFKVYCTSTGQQEALLQHILQIESTESLRCAIVAPVLGARGQHTVSASARRPQRSHLAPVLHHLDNLRRSRRTTRNITTRDSDDSSSSSDESSDDSSSSSSDESSEDNSSSDGDEDKLANKEEHKEEHKNESESNDYPYNVFLEYRTAPARSSDKWGVAIFEGFDKTQHLVATTPQCTSKYKDEKDDYIANLLIEAHSAKLEPLLPAPAVYGTPTLDEPSTLRLICCKYKAREDQDKVIADIKLYCSGRGAAESTHERIKKQWRRANQIPTTPRAVDVLGAVEEPPQHCHPFFAHKELDEWASRFVGAGKSLSRLVYKALVLWSKGGRIGKTEWAKSLGRHIHIRGSLDPEKVHAGIPQGAEVIILDNIKWHRLFDSDLGRALAEGQDSVSWLRRNGEHVTTKLTIPVIILNNKKCKTWGPNNKKYWRKNLKWVRVRKCLFDTAKFINTDAPPVVPQPPSDSLSLVWELVPLPSSSRPVDASGPSSVCSSSPLLPPANLSPLSLPPLQVNRKIERCAPDSYLISDWVSKEDADRQLAAWEKLASHFKLMKYRGNPLARYKAFYCDPLAGSRTMYEYTGSEVESWEEHEWPPEGLQLRNAVRDTIGEPVNSLVANDYWTNKHKITWHFDKPADIAHGTAIATVSLGHARHFQLCPIAEVKRWMDDNKDRRDRMKKNRKQGIKTKLPPVPPLAGVIDIVLPHGSLFVIGPETNEHFMHCIPPSKEKCGRRYGLTFRTIASRWVPDVEVVIRQPPKGETAWNVLHRPKETRKNGPIGQNGYAYRSRNYLEPYTPRDPTRLTEEDIIAVRESMPTRPKMKGRPSRIEDDSDTDAVAAADDSDEGEDSESGEDNESSEEEEPERKSGDDSESSEEEEPERKRPKRKCTTEKTKGTRKKTRKAAESDEEKA